MSARFDELDDGLDNLGQNSTGGEPAATESEAQALPSLNDGRPPRVPSFTPRPPDASDPSGMPPAFDDGWESLHNLRTSSQFSIESDGWGQPIDLTTQLYRGADLPLKLAPAVLQPFLDDIAKRKGVSLAAPFAGLLAACCGVANDHIKLQVKQQDDGWTESARLWCIAVGHPSSGKTPGLWEPIKHVEKMDRDRAIENNIAKENHDFAMAQYKKAYDAAVSKPDGIRPIPPERPSQSQIYLNKFTQEGLRDMAVDSHNGMLVFRDELSGLIGEMDRFSSKGGDSGDREDMLEGYNGGPRIILRAGKRLAIKNWSFSIAGGITPSRITKFKGQLENDGFLQRMFLCICRDKVADVDMPVNKDAEAVYIKVLKNLNTMMPCRVLMEPRAYDCYRAFMDRIRLEIKYEENQSLASHLGKFEGMVPRTMLLYFMIELASQDQHPQDNDRIPLEIAEQVCALFGDWQLGHLREFYHEIMSAKEDRAFAQTIARYILSKPDMEVLKHRDHIAGPHHAAWSKLPDWLRKESLNILQDASWLTPKGSKRTIKGYPSEWLINPQVHKMFAEEAEEIRIYREAKRKDLQKMRGIEV